MSNATPPQKPHQLTKNKIGFDCKQPLTKLVSLQYSGKENSVRGREEEKERSNEGSLGGGARILGPTMRIGSEPPPLFEPKLHQKESIFITVR